MKIEWGVIEEKWRRRWDEAGIFKTDPDNQRTKFYITVAYPYPNSPQHIGHGRTYTLADVHARYKRMRGYNVLFPMAFHYTGTPILAMSDRIESKDEELIGIFRNLYRVPEEKIKEFVEPLKIAQYFHHEIRNGMKEMGFSIDWRREFTTIDPQYSKFIEWQFQKLMNRGYITQGSHPVGWCPRDGNPVGQHDTLGDVEPEIGEYTLVKFELDGFQVPTATLRPETIFGVTNLWINPNENYVKATVDGEKWIISKQSISRFEHLGLKIDILEEVKGSSLVGREAKNPLTGIKIVILPASFVEAGTGTGVVMSVPSHAPYDFQAINDLVSSGKESVIGFDLDSIKPITIISSKKYHDNPAKEIIERFGISSQTDKKLESATQELYSYEFSEGRMMSNTGGYSGLGVREARDRVKADLLDTGNASTLHELMNRPVVCRCGTECVVKVLQNQWFINYGDEGWKEEAREALSQVNLLPKEIRPEFDHTVGWLKGKACARKTGMGTKLPWDHEWIIESLSDSVIYMAYYTISGLIKEKAIIADQLSPEIFDFIFLGIGDPKEISMRSAMQIDLVHEMRNQFLYFYPLDSRHSGRDLVPNHLTFLIFNHTAIFPKTNWPRQIVVNGSVLMEGKKMSKSYGNIIPLRSAVAEYGADPLRLAMMATAELLQDADFSLELVRTFTERLGRLYQLAKKIGENKEYADRSLTELPTLERWLLSKLQRTIQIVTNAMESLRVREAIHQTVYMTDQEIQWYQRRSQSPNPIRMKVLREVLEVRAKLLAPIAPFSAEEIWETLGKGDLLATSQWPESDPAKIDTRAEESEELVRSVLEDIQSIIKVTKVKPKRIFLYVASDWKWKAMLEMLELDSQREGVKTGDLIKSVISEVGKTKGKEVSNFILKMVGERSKLPKDLAAKRQSLGRLDELEVLRDACMFYAAEFQAAVEVFSEDDDAAHDPKGKSRFSKPYRPGIFLE